MNIHGVFGRYGGALLGGAAIALLLAVAAPQVSRADDAGARIYLDGRLPSGADLVGQREAGGPVTGSTAACVNCHRRSGFGTLEGQTLIPPIVGKYLFTERRDLAEDLDAQHVPGYQSMRAPYTRQTLAAAIREGHASTGRELNYLMPRYSLDEQAMQALIDYLSALGSQPTPGVTSDALEFATVVTPDADPVARAAMLEVLEKFISTQNVLIAGGTPPMHSQRGVMYRVTRRWNLQVWDLTGPPETWTAQLNALYAKHPVFALLSGLGGRDWSPVHNFCERNQVPCLFPNVDLPVDSDRDFYSVYFSRGVLLEADILKSRLVPAAASGALRRVVQVYEDDDIGAPAAAALGRALASTPLVVEQHHFSASEMKARLAPLLAKTGPADAVVLWLRPAAIAALPARPPPAGGIYFSGLMAGMEDAPLNDAWRQSAHLAYLFDPPHERQARMIYPHGWFKVQGIAVRSERVQVQTYLGCAIVAEVLGHVLDSFVRDFVLERLEMMVSRRLSNAYYPRLSLAPGQRFASKGGYLVHLTPGGVAPTVIPDGEWIVP